MSGKYRGLTDFLSQHYGTKKGVEGTHTKIPRIINGKRKGAGSYTIPEDEMDIFWGHYYDTVFANREVEYLTERQHQIGSGKTGPLLIDMDFKFDSSVKERRIQKTHLIKFIEAVIDELKTMFTFMDGKEFKVFTAMKQRVNRMDKYTKDGIHFVFTIKMDHVMQCMLRDRMIPKIPKIFEGIDYTNEPSDIYDISISRGSTPWQIYGSRKPDNQPYKLQHYHKIRYNGIQGDFDWDGDGENIKEHTSDRDSYIEMLKDMSARSTNGLDLELNEELKPRYMEFRHKEKAKKKKKIVKSKAKGGGGQEVQGEQGQQCDNNMVSNAYDYNEKIKEMTDLESVKRIRKEMIGKMRNGVYDGPLQITEFNTFEAHQYTMSLSNEYYDPYEAWIRVGWALKNTDPNKLFATWVEFSAQSEKFDFDDFEGAVENMRRIWYEEMNIDEEGLSFPSIIFWLKNQDIARYNEIRNQSISYYLNCTLESDGAEWNFAKLLQKIYGEQFAFAGDKGGWYEFINHRWVPQENDIGLRKKLSENLRPLYLNRQKKVQQKKKAAKNISNEVERKAALENIKEEEAAVKRASKKLTSNTDKNKIMNECKEVFYDPDFYERLDDNPYLMGFSNGVIDFQTKEFRPGKHDDYLSMNTGRPYIAYDEKKHGKIREEVEGFMSQLFPIEELCDYMWEHLASVLIGGNINQTFNMYNGSGSNGKSKLIELMELALGGQNDGGYKGTVPVTLVTKERTGLGAASPEIASLKGIRYAVMQEPSVGDELNPGPFKELTGGDTLQGRHLYKNTITFKPQFSLVVCTNDMFDIKATDDGTWRRIKPVPFLSKFSDKKPFADPVNEKWQFAIDLNIKNNFERWVDVFMALLVKKAFETDGKVKKCSVIEKRKRKYRMSQDPIHEFIYDSIIKDPNNDEFISNRDIWNAYTTWYKSIRGNDPKGRSKFYDTFSKQIDCELVKNPENKKQRGWIGISLVENEVSDPNPI